MDFINVCNTSEIFINKKLNLLPIEAEFGKEHNDEITKQIRKGYNKAQKKIVQMQNFHSAFQSAAYDTLQAAVDFDNIIFAGKVQAVKGRLAQLAEQSIGDIHKTHEQFCDEKDGNPILSFIERQDHLLDLTRSEMALIEVSVSKLGTRSFDIPQSLKRAKEANRARKDLVSSLMLATWCTKLYLDSLNLQVEEFSDLYTPKMIGR